MLHTVVQAGMLALILGMSSPPARPAAPVQAVERPGIAREHAPETVGAGPFAKAVCLFCLGFLLSGGTSVAAVVVTALFNPELAFACGGICLGAF